MSRTRGWTAVAIAIVCALVACTAVVSSVSAASMSPAETILMEAAQRHQLAAHAEAPVHAEPTARNQMESEAETETEADSEVDSAESILSEILSQTESSEEQPPIDEALLEQRAKEFEAKFEPTTALVEEAGVLVKIPNPAQEGTFLKVRVPEPGKQATNATAGEKSSKKARAARRAALKACRAKYGKKSKRCRKYLSKKAKKNAKKKADKKKAKKAKKSTAKKANKKAKSKKSKKAKKGKKAKKAAAKAKKAEKKKAKKAKKSKKSKKAKKAKTSKKSSPKASKSSKAARAARKAQRAAARAARAADRQAKRAAEKAREACKGNEKCLRAVKRAQHKPTPKELKLFAAAKAKAALLQAKELDPKGNYELKTTTITVPDPHNPGFTADVKVQVKVPGKPKDEPLIKTEKKTLNVPDPAHPGKTVQQVVEVTRAYKTIRQTVADPLNYGQLRTVDVQVETALPAKKPKAAFDNANQVIEKHIDRLTNNIRRLKEHVQVAKLRRHDSPVLEDGAPAPPDRQELEMAHNLYKILDSELTQKAVEIRQRYLDEARDQLLLSDDQHEKFDNFRLKMNEETLLPSKDW